MGANGDRDGEIESLLYQSSSLQAHIVRSKHVKTDVETRARANEETFKFSLAAGGWVGDRPGICVSAYAISNGAKRKASFRNHQQLREIQASMRPCESPYLIYFASLNIVEQKSISNEP